METITARASFIVFLLLAGCEESVLEGMAGRWAGTVFCFSGEGELTMHLTIEGSKLVGTGQTRFKGNNKSWKATGSAATSCIEDTCRSYRDCPFGYDTGDFRAGDLRKCIINPTCAAKCKSGDPKCDPCQECKPCQICDRCREDWLPVNLLFEDDHVLVPDPELKLWRFGSAFIKGSIYDFCPDAKALWPVVELHKD
jgi:hypothetical protein